MHLYRREPVRVSGAALVLLAPGLIMGVGSGAFIDRIQDETQSGRIVVAVVIGILAAVFGTLGTVFYAGVLDELVGAVIRGQEPPAMGEVVRQLPVWRLIGADLLVVLIVAVASLLLFLPGFVLLAMLSTVGPIVNIEGRRVIPSIRRAVSLTFPHLWLTLMTIGIPLAVEFAADHYFLHLEGDLGVCDRVPGRRAPHPDGRRDRRPERGGAGLRALGQGSRFLSGRDGVLESVADYDDVMASAKLSKLST